MKIVMIILMLTAPALASPLRRPAREHLERGTARYKSGDYAGAITELELGRQLDPQPVFHYTLGQAYRKLGDCKSAVDHYTAFLESHPPEVDAAAVRKNIARCTPEPEKPIAQPLGVASEPAPVPPPPDPITTPPAGTIVAPDFDARPSDQPARDDQPRHWYRDIAGGALAAGGLGGIAFGATYFLRGEHDIVAANAATTIAHRQELSTVAHHERVLGTIGAVAGGALLVGAAVRYVLVGRDHRPPDHVVSVAVDRDGAYAVWSGSF